MGKKGQVAWNKGISGCRRGHNANEWHVSQTGIGICLACKRANGAKWRGNNKLQRRIAGQNYQRRQRSLVLAHYGPEGKPQCWLCGFGDVRALSIDHINGDGAAHRKTFKGHIEKWLRDNGLPLGFQTLCLNCHAIKTLEHGDSLRNHLT